ncbi:phage shock protein operon transcriptional activator [Aliivibrio kagoshimensis]|uniref:phage shock protein operon transcriptional activator n=1 Tax=Aliivibrio kagoshimensis TaxID=2910230 RepID=UPI003D0EAF12
MRKPEALIGESESFLSVLDQTSRLAAIDRPILILGERGTGKELIAKRLHYLSKRWNQSLISLNCAALGEGVIDSELFGHESGSFTGAKNRHQGRFERAEGGTLFLDELATAPVGVQEKLLRVIEYGEYERVGGSKTQTSDVRLICATNTDLHQLIEQGKFRADLLDRLAFDVIHLPPLRHREGDILLLAEHYAIKMCQEIGLTYFPGFSVHAKAVLASYAWPGNIRELKNVIERSVFHHGVEDMEVDTIYLDPFATAWTDTPKEEKDEQISNKTELPTLPMNFKTWQHEQEKSLLELAMKTSQFNQRKAADSLGLSYHQLRGMLRKHAFEGDLEK